MAYRKRSSRRRGSAGRRRRSSRGFGSRIKIPAGPGRIGYRL